MRFEARMSVDRPARARPGREEGGDMPPETQWRGRIVGGAALFLLGKSFGGTAI